MTRRFPPLIFVLVMLPAWILSSRAAQLPAVSDAIAWYDTLGYPDAKELPYVRVATGMWIQTGNQPRENQFVEGFLVREDDESFTVFLCNVSSLTSRRDDSGRRPYAALTTVRFVRKTSGPASEQVGYDLLDFPTVAEAVLDRVREQASRRDGFLLDALGRPVTHRARIFAFARASLQKGLPDVGEALMDLAANIPIDQTGEVAPGKLRDVLQRQIGNAVLAQAEIDAGDPAISWTALLKTYADFDTRFPASDRIAYAKEAADALRRMIAEDAGHHPPPLEEMSPAEQAAEAIYQLRNLKMDHWISNERYPVITPRIDGKDVITPVHRLVDLGSEAVPSLIAALDDRSFTRSKQPSFNGTELPVAMRVRDFARHLLEFMSGRNFFPRQMKDGTMGGRLVSDEDLANDTRQQAEAWWAELQAKGERQQLIDAASAGGGEGVNAAGKLVEKYPDAAINAIEAGILATPDRRRDYVDVSAKVPGDAPVAFLRSQLAPGAGVYAQVAAAKALLARGQSDGVSPMIEAWRTLHPRLRTNESDAYGEAGGLITFLATSGDVRAIDALGLDIRNAPVDARLAVVRVFLPPARSAGGSSQGPGISAYTDVDMTKLPDGAAGSAIERLLVAALDDREARVDMEGTFNEVSYKDPRVCDMAAFVLSRRWPEKYHFDWMASPADRDAQISGLRETWRSQNGLQR